MLTDSPTWRTPLAAVYGMNAANNHPGFAAAAVVRLRRLIEADVTVFQILEKTLL